ncbi:FGGY-family carbohydrate kinase [Streptomyces sp. AK02-01A]|uniref:FGGY-family carbohydrate kinase n=1 Tax=Streptomyces sp. AK02-01A TaxID=3028648 RepID=UPI0029ABE870|nr:FGGY family carbohydrate kinase [Streptomyces sp. AK02-01A]MDX3850168.1 FGGY family carbohydrate kinase [Streptomyces sp. AK02-01A]
MGVDLGTQGVRALAVTDDGRVLGRGSAPLTGHRDGNRHEQRPSDWWDGVRAAIRRTLRPLAAARVRGLAVCGTSGTVLLTDSRGTPLTPALMYDDGRAVAEARFAQEAGAAVWRSLGHRIQPSWALAKLVWLTRPGRDGGTSDFRGARVCHQADFITTRLVGRPVPTDSSHALKTGYDQRTGAWPTAVHEELGLSGLDFPAVLPPGALLGTVCREAADATGLAEGTPVVAGMTDGCAAQLGSGAWEVGRWNTVLGTTLVLKGVTAAPLHDPDGILYSHRSPDGHWLPGGASSVGAGALNRAFPEADLARLDRLAAAREPSSVVAYPLVSRGERFPFLAGDAEAFMLGRPADDADHHAALLQGVALVERLCLAYVQRLGAEVDGPVTFTGGATRSPYWNQLRADVLGRTAIVPEHTDSALGMAVLAAHGVTRGGASTAQGAGGSAGPTGPTPLSALRGMVRVRTVLEPRPGAARRFAEPFGTLVDELERRGWLPSRTAAHAREHG